MTGLLSPRSIRIMQWITCAACAAAFVFCIAKTLHWQVVWDQSVIRYVRFLMSRGFRPYRDITDMNMPGCYLMEAWAMAIFGWSDLSWRVYEYCLMGAIALAGALLPGRRNWMTGVHGAAIFMLVRFSEGEAFSLERNEIMGILDLLGLAFFFFAVQKRKPVFLGVASAFITLAASMKPGGFLLEILLLGLMIVTLRRERVSLCNYLLWAAAGITFVCAIMLGFLLHAHGLHEFFFIISKVWPTFRKMSPQTSLELLIVPRYVLPSALLAACAAWISRAETGWQRWAFILAMVYGIVSYKLEGGNAHYHRYVFLIFLAMWIGWELSTALRRDDRASRVLGVLGLAVLVGLVVPHYVYHLQSVAYAAPELEAYPAALQSDLTSLGGEKLQGQVECLEMVDGCLRTLYEMRLVQNTASTGDLLLFTTMQSASVEHYRDWYWRTQEANPANVIVLGNFWFESKNRSFDRIDTWPAYAAYLRSNYVLKLERHFSSADAAGYRLYVRKGSAITTSTALPSA